MVQNAVEGLVGHGIHRFPCYEIVAAQEHSARRLCSRHP
jgi:hypothetical protein